MLTDGLLLAVSNLLIRNAMSHSATKIYTETVSGVKHGVSIYDIQAVLGIFSRNDIGGLINYAKSVGALNMWARKKPVPWSTGSTPVRNPQELHPNDWFKGKDANFGIVSKTHYSVANISSIIAEFDGGLNGWQYQIDSLAHRFLDFDGYYKNAANPFDGLDIVVSTPLVPPSGTVVIEYRFSGTASNPTDEIALDEVICKSIPESNPGVIALSSMYLAILVYKINGASYDFIGWETSANSLSGLVGDAARNVQFSLSSASTGNYIVVPLLCENKRTNQPVTADNAWSLIPGKSILNFSVATETQPSMYVDAFVWVNNGVYGNTIYYRVAFTAGNLNSYSFSGVTMQFATQGGTVLQTVNNVQDPTGAALTVPAGATTYVPSSDYSSVQWSGGVSMQTFIEQQGGKVILSSIGVSTFETQIGARPVRD